jgi:2-C-methyl-D-erythritol 2,4-cyclodiphosphate synthase
MQAVLMHKTGIGQDSHRFEQEGSTKPLVLGGVIIPGIPGLHGNSDADVVLHALTNAISGVTSVNILGEVSDKLCLEQGITDSTAFLKEAIKHLKGFRISHISLSIEAYRPKLAPFISMMKTSIANLSNLKPDNVGITATSGEQLTAFGKGEGIQVIAIVSVSDGKDI